MGANAFDLIIILLFAWSAYSGYTNGLIASAASLIALLLGVWGAIKFSSVVGVYLTNVIHIDERYLNLIAFAITFILIVIAVHFIGKAIEGIAEAAALGLVNKVFGAAFGILKFAFIISVILVFFKVANKKISFLTPEFKEKSLFFNPISNFAPSIFNYLHFDEFKNEEEENVVV